MKQEVYEKLARHLDQLPAGFPRTESGVELRILMRLFTEEEAELACHVTHLPATAEKIARRADRPVRELADLLERMSLKGLLFRIERLEGNLYMAAQFVVGIYEYNVNNLDPDMIRDTEEYVPILLGGLTRIETQQFRTIPIGASLDGSGRVLPYEEVRNLIEEQSKLLVAPCICRKESEMTGKGCGKPLETCNICLCCGDCCQVLKVLNRHPSPARVSRSNYVARVRAEDCLGCAFCLDRCQMKALQINGNVAELDDERCIGCGLCVPTCSGQAIELVRKEDGECTVPPVDIRETYLRMTRERGLLK